MSSGGFFAALAFIAAAFIQMAIQANIPSPESLGNSTNLILINGVNDCSIKNPTIWLDSTKGNVNSTNMPSNFSLPLPMPHLISPLSLTSFILPPVDDSDNSNYYKIKFNLASTVTYGGNTNLTNSDSNGNGTQIRPGCALDSTKHELNLGKLPTSSVKIAYIRSAGNGSLIPHFITADFQIPRTDVAQVQFLYNYNGSSLEHPEKKVFTLTNFETNPQDKNMSINSYWNYNNGSVLMSRNLNVSVPNDKVHFLLNSPDNNAYASKLFGFPVMLKPGTQNLIVVQHRNDSELNMGHNVVLDNSYELSILWQVIPYVFMAVAEILFNLTGLEYSYQSAPKSMKSTVLAGWNMTNAIGSVVSVFLTSFASTHGPTSDYLLYATLTIIDTIVFTYIGQKFHQNSAPANNN